MTQQKTEGLIAATFTPMQANGGLDLNKIAPMVDNLIANGVKGIFICGSTGEGPSLTTAERKLLAEAFIQAAAKRIRVFVHVGHNSIAEAKDLAAHAQRSGADYISATPPCYFKIKSIQALEACLAEIASGAPELPLYYYNIPALTGADLDMAELLRRAEVSLPTLAGIKYTTPLIHEYQACLNFEHKKYDLLYGTDEMLLSALAAGAKGFIGSTYNFAAPIYRKLQYSFDHHDLDAAQNRQMKSVRMVQVINKYGGLPAQKAIMKLIGMDCGPVRLPLLKLKSGEFEAIERELREIDFFADIFDRNMMQ